MSIAMGFIKLFMVREHRSLYDLETTLQRVRKQARAAGWHIPFEFSLEDTYREHGIEDMIPAVNIFLCDPPAGRELSAKDEFKAMLVMMPTVMSIYQRSDGEVRVCRMRLGTMKNMFFGAARRVLANGEARLQKTLEGIVEPPTEMRLPLPMRICPICRGMFALHEAMS